MEKVEPAKSVDRSGLEREDAPWLESTIMERSVGGPPADDGPWLGGGKIFIFMESIAGGGPSVGREP